jgi:F0F1-type ATP synthase assembly protein I
VFSNGDDRCPSFSFWSYDALDQSGENKPLTANEQKAKKYASNTALAIELPFTIVGAVVFGGLIGYFVDHWLHTKVIFTFILGGLGFAGGIKEVLRRIG